MRSACAASAWRSAAPEAAIKAGIALIPEDRRRQGLVLQHTVKDNLVLAMLDKLAWGGLMNDRRADQVAASFVQQLEIKTESIAKLVEPALGWQPAKGGDRQVAGHRAADPDHG